MRGQCNIKQHVTHGLTFFASSPTRTPHTPNDGCAKIATSNTAPQEGLPTLWAEPHTVAGGTVHAQVGARLACVWYHEAPPLALMSVLTRTVFSSSRCLKALPSSLGSFPRPATLFLLLHVTEFYGCNTPMCACIHASPAANDVRISTPMCACFQSSPAANECMWSSTVPSSMCA